MATVIGLVYAALSLVIGGMSATIVLWRPGLFERASADRNLRLPKTLYELVSFGLHMALFWPLLVLMTIRDRRGGEVVMARPYKTLSPPVVVLLCEACRRQMHGREYAGWITDV